MPTRAVTKIINSLLKQADTAIIGQQWNTVDVLAEEALKLDKTNTEALSLKTTAMRVLADPTVPIGTSSLGIDLAVLSDPNAPEIPPDPDNAIYYSLIGNCFSFDANKMSIGNTSVYLNNDAYGVARAFMPIHLPEGVNIWGWRCNVNSTGGNILVRLHMLCLEDNPPFEKNTHVQLGHQASSSMGIPSDLYDTGLNQPVKNRQRAFHLQVSMYRETDGPICVYGAVIIYQPS